MATVTISDDLVTAMARDVTRHTLTRPRTMLIWGLLALVILLEVGGFVVQAADGGLKPGLSWVVTGAAILLPGYILIATSRSTRRAVAAAFPAGSTVTADVLGDRLSLTTVRGATDVALCTFHRASVLPRTVLLQQSASRVGIVVPRAALDDWALDALRSGIGR